MEAEQQLKLIIDSIKQSVDNSLSTTNMKKLAVDAAQNVKTRTRKGKGVNSLGGSEKQLPSLAENTVKRRESLKRRSKLNFNTTPKKSNLTRSGQLTSDIMGTSTHKANGQVFIDSGRRNQFSGKSSSEVAKEVEDIGFKFFNFSKREVLSIVKDYGLILSKEIVRILNRIKSQ